MTKDDRELTKEMIENVFAIIQHDLMLQNNITNTSLARIDKHLENLNSKVASHEKIINQNLPHNISLCPQSKTITEIRDNMISTGSMRKTITTSIAATGTVFSILFILYKVFIESAIS
jgi:hypothetical protein